MHIFLKISEEAKVKYDNKFKVNFPFAWKTNTAFRYAIRVLLDNEQQSSYFERYDWEDVCREMENFEKTDIANDPEIKANKFSDLKREVKRKPNLEVNLANTIVQKGSPKKKFQSYQTSDISNFNVIKIGHDGNYLFRSLSYGYFGNEEKYVEVRKGIVGYVKGNWENLVDQLNATCVETQYKNAEEYVIYMAENKIFGTEFEIGIFVNLYECKVELYPLNRVNELAKR